MVLVYLGFLNAVEMAQNGEVFHNHGEWERVVKEHSRPLFPTEVWHKQWPVKAAALLPRIVSDEIAYDAPIDGS